MKFNLLNLKMEIDEKEKLEELRKIEEKKARLARKSCKY